MNLLDKLWVALVAVSALGCVTALAYVLWVLFQLGAATVRLLGWLVVVLAS